jgi:PadR family transcriptional regulator, regulatory protein AphA
MSSPRTVSRTAQAPLTATECAVLGLLTRGERSGYDLAKKAEASVGWVWAPARSQIYAVLPRLVRAGLARRRKVVQSGRPDKQVYRITKRGREAVREWLESSDDRDDTFLLRVFFGDLMAREALVGLIERERELSRERLTQFREIEETGPDYYPHLTLRWGFAYRRAVIRWADEVLRELGQVQEV